MADAREVGGRISYHRKRLGLSQVEFAGIVGKSESWVSQVERGVRGIDRLSVLQTVANALDLSLAELRGEAETESAIEEHPQAFETLRLTLTGHPTPSTILAPLSVSRADVPSLNSLRDDHSSVWRMVHESHYSELAPLLSRLITSLELSTRHAATEADANEARRLLADTYQATSAALAKIGEADAAWIAADRASFISEALGSPLAVAASLFRMAHVFLSLGHLPQAHKVAASAEAALDLRISTDADTETLSLYGAFKLVLAITAARENERGEAHRHLDAAREIAVRVGEGRNDFGTEFGPTNVALHAVSVAVELGDAGQALELSRDVVPTNLSAERQARYLIDLAAAHAMRRQIGEALRCLQEAEELTPEQTRTHRVARDVTRVLLQLSGVRVRPELRELAERFGIA